MHYVLLHIMDFKGNIAFYSFTVTLCLSTPLATIHGSHLKRLTVTPVIKNINFIIQYFAILDVSWTINYRHAQVLKFFIEIEEHCMIGRILMMQPKISSTKRS